MKFGYIKKKKSISMKNIQEYHEYRLNEASNLFFQRHNYPEKYKDRVKKIDPKLSDNPVVLSRVRNFFQKMEDKIESMAYYGKQAQQLRRAERGGGPNTGIEALFGLTSIVPNILKKVFGSTKVQWGKIPQDNEVNVEFMRHVNEDFAKNELPYIQNEAHLQDNILKMYKKAGVGKGYSPVLDDIAQNRVNLYYTREMNPQYFPYMSSMTVPYRGGTIQSTHGESPIGSKTEIE